VARMSADFPCATHRWPAPPASGAGRRLPHAGRHRAAGRRLLPGLLRAAAPARLRHPHGCSALHVGLVFLLIAVATIAGAQTGCEVVARVNAKNVAGVSLALATAGHALAARWTQPAVMVTRLSIAALGIGAAFVIAFAAGWRPRRSGCAGSRRPRCWRARPRPGPRGWAAVAAVMVPAASQAHTKEELAITVSTCRSPGQAPRRRRAQPGPGGGGRSTTRRRCAGRAGHNPAGCRPARW